MLVMSLKKSFFKRYMYEGTKGIVRKRINIFSASDFLGVVNSDII